MGYLRKDTMVTKENQNAYVDFQINRGLNSPASRHEPEFQQMFTHTHFKSGDTELGKTNLKEGYVEPAVAFIQPIEPVITSAHTLHEGENINTGTLWVDSVPTFVGTSVGLKELPRPSLKDRKQGEIFEDRPSMDAKEALKRRHDLSLRQMMRLEKDSGDPYSVSKRPDIYETPKIAPWTQKEPTSKYYVESEMDMKIPTLKHDRGPRGLRGTRDLDNLSNRDVKFRSTRASQDSFIVPKKADKYHHDKIKQGLYDSEEGPKKIKKLEDRYIVDEELKLQSSVDTIIHKTKKPEQHVAKSKSGPIDSMGNVLEHQYSFFFPKVMEKKEKKAKINVSSSQLIKDTQDKLRLQAEKKRQEEEHKKKLEQAQKKNVVREEKRLQAKRKKRKSVEEQTTYEKEQRKLQEEQRKLEEEQRKLEEEQRKLEKEQKKLAEEKYTEKQHKVKGKISKVSMVAKKDVIPKSDRTVHREKTDGVTDKSSKDVQSGIKQENKEEAQTVVKAIHKQEDKSVAKEQKIKPEKNDLDEKLQTGKTDNENLKQQLEQLRKEKEARKAQTAKVLDALSKKGKDSKKTQDDGAIKVSMSNIQKSLKKESSIKQETLQIKRGKGKESDGKILKKEPSKTMGEISELQKLRAEHLKEKENALKSKMQLENEAKVAKEKEEAERNAKKEKKRIKMQKEYSGANLELVKFKQAAKVRPSDIHPKVRMIHKCNHQHSGKKSSRCQLCADSDLELEVLSLDNKINVTTDKTDIIIGEKIFKYKPRLEKIQEPEGVPILFQKEFCLKPEQQLMIPEQKEIQLPKKKKI